MVHIWGKAVPSGKCDGTQAKAHQRKALAWTGGLPKQLSLSDENRVFRELMSTGQVVPWGLVRCWRLCEGGSHCQGRHFMSGIWVGRLKVLETSMSPGGMQEVQGVLCGLEK